MCPEDPGHTKHFFIRIQSVKNAVTNTMQRMSKDGIVIQWNALLASTGFFEGKFPACLK
jgi:hypothetical protein